MNLQDQIKAAKDVLQTRRQVADTLELQETVKVLFPLDEIKVEKVIGTSDEFEANILANLTSDKDVDEFISRYEESNKEQLRITLDKDW